MITCYFCEDPLYSDRYKAECIKCCLKYNVSSVITNHATEDVFSVIIRNDKLNYHAMFCPNNFQLKIYNLSKYNIIFHNKIKLNNKSDLFNKINNLINFI